MKKYFICILLFFLCPAITMAQRVAPFQNGDRVVFTGNSITDGGHYHSYIWLYYLTHFPGRRIEVYNAGIGGDVARQMLERLDADVFAHHPTVVTLGFGMNDTGYQWLSGKQADSAYAAKISTALASFQQIVQRFQQHPEVKKVMIASSPYDEKARINAILLTGKNKALLKIVDAQQQTASKYGWGFVNFNRAITAVNEKGQQTDSAFTVNGTDRIHPTNDGHMVMAYEFLKTQGLAGQKVADIRISAASGKLLKAENCTITNIKPGKDKLTFDYLARALPYPVDTIPHNNPNPAHAQSAALKLVPFTEDFNQELLGITQVDAGANYTLRIDGKMIGTYAGEILAKGINLATLHQTPQYQQALAIMHINEERWEIERRLREYWWIHYSILKPRGLLHNDEESTVDSLQKYAKKDYFVAATVPTYRKARLKPVRDAWQREIALLTGQMYSINKPVIHHIEISKAN